jgi:hypothetical protein
MLDRLAVALAGMEAQHLFRAPTHDMAGLSDLALARDIIDDDELPAEKGRQLRAAGYERARRILCANSEKVARLVQRLVAAGCVNADEFLELMQGTAV